jgi:hypothetical protein
MSGSPYQGPGSGLTPPISYVMPSTPLRPSLANAGAIPTPRPSSPGTRSNTLLLLCSVVLLLVVVGIAISFARARGRDAGCPAPPAQIPASGTTALGSSLGCERQSARQARDGRSGGTAAICFGDAASAPRSAACAGCDVEAPCARAARPRNGRRTALDDCQARRSSRRARAGRWPTSVPARQRADRGALAARPAGREAWPATASSR